MIINKIILYLIYSNAGNSRGLLKRAYIIVLTNRLMEWNLDNPFYKKKVELGIACTVDLLWGYPYLVKLFQDGVLCPSVVLSLHKHPALQEGSGARGDWFMPPWDVPILRDCIDESLCSSMRKGLRGVLHASSAIYVYIEFKPFGTALASPPVARRTKIYPVLGRLGLKTNSLI